ncbi:MAG: ribosomal-processing cysteine protease Prp [Clostridia bacterium]|nr:ribosomal-processing cysteine protease Prp [Clostridia bacterium]
MTTATIFRSKGHTVGFEVSGHALAGEEGNDIVCSAISALSQTALMGIVELLRLECAYEVAYGNIYCMLGSGVTGQEEEKAEIIFDTMALGLRSIAENYKENLKVIEKEV